MVRPRRRALGGTPSLCPDGGRPTSRAWGRETPPAAPSHPAPNAGRSPPRTRGRVPPRRTRRCRPKPCPWPPLTLQRAEGNHHADRWASKPQIAPVGGRTPPLSRGRRSQSPKPSTHRSCRAFRGAPFMLRLCTRPSRFDGRGHRVDHTYRHATPRTAPSDGGRQSATILPRPRTEPVKPHQAMGQHRSPPVGSPPSDHAGPHAILHTRQRATPQTTPGGGRDPGQSVAS
jgi:hypothetical protein